MTADPYARLDAAYLLGALDADERLSYETHLVLPTVPGGPGRDFRDPVAAGRTGRVRLRRTARGGPDASP
jgi:hypothetical protein